MGELSSNARLRGLSAPIGVPGRRGAAPYEYVEDFALSVGYAATITPKEEFLPE